MPTLLDAAPPRVVLGTVVLSGEAAPDGNGIFQSFSAPILSDSGQVVFHTFFSDTLGGRADDIGLYRGDTHSAALQIIREGQAAPDGNGTFGLSTGRFGQFDLPSINSVGQVAFRGIFEGTNAEAGGVAGIFRWDGENQLVTIARYDSEVVGHPVISSFDSPYAIFFQPDLNDLGQVGFLAQFTPHNNSGSPIRGVLLGDGVSPIQLAAQTFQPTPDGNDRLGNFIGAALVINNHGQAAISTATADLFNEGIFRGDSSGALVQVARTGQIILDSDDTLGDFITADDSIAINDPGQVAFVGDIRSSASKAIFLSDGPGELVPIVRSGRAAPDGNGVLSLLPDNPPFFLLNNSGQVAFQTSLSGTISGQDDDQGIYLGDGEGGLLQVAREGQASPGGDGVLGDLGRPGEFHLNDSGQVAFAASVRVASDTAEVYGGIYLFDELQGLIEIAREGDAYLGSTITRVSLFDASYARTGISPGNNRSSLNEAGQVAFSFGLADGRSGVAIAGIVPEPSTLLLSITWVAAALRRTRRRVPARRCL